MLVHGCLRKTRSGARHEVLIDPHPAYIPWARVGMHTTFAAEGAWRTGEVSAHVGLGCLLGLDGQISHHIWDYVIAGLLHAMLQVRACVRVGTTSHGTIQLSWVN